MKYNTTAFKDSIIEKINIESYCSEHLEKSRISGVELTACCPFHNDHHPSFCISTESGLFKCHACGEEGNLFHLHGFLHCLDFKEALGDLASRAGIEIPAREKKPVIKSTVIMSMVKELHNNRALLDKLLFTRHLDKKTIKDAKIGWDGERYTIPIYDPAGRLVNIRRYNPDSKPKILNYTSGKGKYKYSYGSPARLYGADQLKKSDGIVIVCEGEFDKLVLQRYGYISVTGTSGCNTWRREWSWQFKDRDVVIIYDSDDAGRRAARNIVAPKLVKFAKRLRIVELQFSESTGKDVTDWFLSGRTVTELESLIKDAQVVEKNNIEWQERLKLTVDKYGQLKLVKNESNLVEIFLHDDKWINNIVYNEFSMEKFWKRSPLPGLVGNIKENGISPVQGQLFDDWGINFPIKMIFESLLEAADYNPIHPVREYLNSLRWDGNKRVDRWLYSYLGAKDNLLSAIIGGKWMISAVARIFNPGCQVDHVLILEGEQGLGKSTAVRILAGDWYLPNLGDLSNKDSMLYLLGSWIVEIAELDSFQGVRATRIKDFISRTVDKFRPPYERVTVTKPRQCIFVGTTNDSVYLNDSTGNRRFWPVKVQKLHREALMRDRDQLWAEAVQKYENNEPWWPDETESDGLKKKQEERRRVDPWEETIYEHLSRSAEEYIRLEQIWRLLDFDDISKRTSREEQRIGKIIKKLGWKKKRIRINGILKNVYIMDKPNPC